MRIETLNLENFRNYSNLNISFSDNINIFYGDNAQGKTNILEAIYLCSSSKSHRTSVDKDLIRFDQDEAHVNMVYNKAFTDHKIDIHLRRTGKKGVAIDGIPVRKISEIIGNIDVILFSPEDLGIIKNGPNFRRKFMDMQICQYDKVYLSYLTKYNKIVDQRNSLLKQIYDDRNLLATLDIWDEQLAYYGAYIISERKKYVDILNEIAFDIHGNITSEKEKINISYEVSCDEDSILDELHRKRERDIKLKNTSTGPHHDDLAIFINDIDTRRFASQGQQRSAALSLKLSEIEIIKKIKKENPILLLDDVLSELDSKRQDCLLSSIKGYQTMMTSTGLDEYIQKRYEIDKVFNIKNGEVVL